jgi:hypothetical protein
MRMMRPEAPGEAAAIHDVNTLAFGQSQEADLVDALRRHGGLTISLVAVHESSIVWYITFSSMTITADTATLDALGLAPMAVVPEDHNTGMGSKRVEAGLHACHHTLPASPAGGHPAPATRAAPPARCGSPAGAARSTAARLWRVLDRRRRLGLPRHLEGPHGKR